MTFGVILRDIWRITPSLSENYSETLGVILPNERKFLGEVTYCYTSRYIILRIRDNNTKSAEHAQRIYSNIIKILL